jgi:hypothetical protein
LTRFLGTILDGLEQWWRWNFLCSGLALLLLWFLFLLAFGLWRGGFFFTIVTIGDVVRKEVAIAVPTASLGIGGDSFLLH